MFTQLAALRSSPNALRSSPNDLPSVSGAAGPLASALLPARLLTAVQGTFDDLDRAWSVTTSSATTLSATTFVVVDLETTGGSPADCSITEVGAVKVRGGEVLGEFQTLVRPAGGIPPFIAVLTGITDAMVATAPSIDAVLPAFLEFAEGSVLVAHNAPFDVGFLRTACAATARQWPRFDVVDTARLARRVLSKDDVPNCKLSTLAAYFSASTAPQHRALADAKATVDVLHGLLARLGNSGVATLADLRTWQSRVSPQQRSKRHLAERLPHAPGVYMFLDSAGKALYVGTSRDVRTRVRRYFTASETRARMSEMVGLTQTITAIVCATSLEAEVRELRLIAEHKPRYNRRSRFPERGSWLKLTVEVFPRLSIVREVRRDGAAYLGPFGSRHTALAAMTAIHEATRLRQCTDRLSVNARRSPCALEGMGRCGAPCSGAESVADYAVHAEAVRDAIAADAASLVERLLSRITRLSDTERYEEAAVHRDRMNAFVRAAARTQRIAALAAIPELVAARRLETGGWELEVVRFGRLVASGCSPPGAHPQPYIDALVATAEHVEPPPRPTAAATAEEAECILRWLEAPGARLVDIRGHWASPVRGAGGLLGRFGPDTAAAARPFDDRRPLAPIPQPVA